MINCVSVRSNQTYYPKEAPCSREIVQQQLIIGLHNLSSGHSNYAILHQVTNFVGGNLKNTLVPLGAGVDCHKCSLQLIIAGSQEAT